MRVVSVAEMRDLEAQTFAAGTSEALLQERAGKSVARHIARGAAPGRVVALIGPGNNGRDAWIAARTLLLEGWDATLYLTPRHAIADDELRELIHFGGHLVWHTESATGSP